MSKRKTLGRRDFLRLSAFATGAALLTACGAPQPSTPQPTAGAKAPAPAAGGAATPQPAAAAAAGGKPKLGSNLVGKFGGPTLITDTAKYPKSFKEAPMLADQVKAGKLPPVEQRLPKEPLVFQPYEGIGKYGGVMRRAFSGPDDQWCSRRVSGSDTFLWMNYDATKSVPNLAKSWDVSQDGKEVTLHLREGLKWSDGHPFTSEDVMFWFEDMYSNKEYNPTPSADMTINGKPVAVQKVDDYTVKFVAPDSYYSLVTLLSGNGAATGGQTLRGIEAGGGGYAPAHYLKQFHPKYTPKEQLDKVLKDGKYDNWVKLLRDRDTDNLNPDLPVLTPWKTVTPINTPQWVLERNPYCWFVDTEGNQLPYIDKLVLNLAENLEVLNLRAIAGELDFQARSIDLSKLPVLLENQAKGGYKVSLHPADVGTDAGLSFNMAYDKDAEINKWFNNVDFRRALSMGIDRDQLNETFWLGTGTPGSVAPAETSIYSPGPEFRTKWHTLDVKQANSLLDKIGLDKKDGEGFRQRTDGQGRLRVELMTYSGQFMNFTAIAEMIVQMLKKIGIEMNIKEVDRNLGITRITANEHQLFMWTDDDGPDLLASVGKTFPVRPGGWCFHGQPFAQWYASAGKQGKAPTDKALLDAMEKLRKMPGVPDDQRIQLVKEIWATAVDQVWTAGTVGLSPSTGGVLVAKSNLGNVAPRTPCGALYRSPLLMQPATIYWKS
ncbi:MAG TPA: ABC transporter substrate-binding protein [Chloroflexota bacterium]